MKLTIVELAIVGLILVLIGDILQVNWKSPQALSAVGWTFLNIAWVWIIWVIYKEFKSKEY